MGAHQDFQQQADTFHLTVVYNRVRLMILLRDFTDWAVYSKEYTEKDIGGEIDQKMKLSDVFTAFQRSKQHQVADENSTEDIRLRHYRFGTVLEDDGTPCYKIENGGKITVYIQRNSQEDTIWESKLLLQKARNMTEAEIKEETNKRIFFEELKRKNYQLEKEKQGNLSRIIYLEEENEIIREELQSFKEEQNQKNLRFEEKITQLSKQGQKLEQKMNENNRQLDQNNQELVKILEEQFTDQVTQQIYKTKQQLENKVTLTRQEYEQILARECNWINQKNTHNIIAQSGQVKYHLEQKIKQANQQLEQKIIQQLIKSNQQLVEKNKQLQYKLDLLIEQFERSEQHSMDDEFYQISSLRSVQQSQRILNGLVQKLHNLTQANRQYFKLDGLKVQYTSQNSTWTQYIFNMPINDNEKVRFKLKITKMSDKWMMIGVIDYAKQKDQRSSFNSPNAMCYFSRGGGKYPERMYEGDGFKQGDIVEVQVNRSTGTVKYIVNGDLKATQQKHILGDNSRIFMPYVEMNITNDVVEWMP